MGDRQTSAMSWNPGSWTSNKSEPTQTREQWKTTQDPAKRMQDALARLAELPDGGSDDNKRTKKRLYQKVTKLKAQLQLDVKEKVQRKAGWTDAEKAKMRAAGAWARVAPLDVTIEQDSVEKLLEARTEAKKEKNYAVADQHAATLQQMGVCYDDSTHTWFVKAPKRKAEDEPEKKKSKKKKKKATDEQEEDEETPKKTRKQKQEENFAKKKKKTK